MKFLFLFFVSVGAFAADASFVDCGGSLEVTKGGSSKKFSGHVKVIPFPKENGLRGQMDWKAVVDSPQGKFEIKPVQVSFSLIRQALTIAYSAAEGDMELGISMDEKSRINGHQRGDFGLSLKDSTSIDGLGLECVLSKHLVD